MGLAFLPWEKLPGVLLGLLMMLLSGGIAWNEAPYSYEQFKSLGLFMFGLGIFVYDMRRRMKADIAAEKARLDKRE